MQRVAAALVLALAVASSLSTGSAQNLQDCMCVAPKPCHYQGYCSVLVGGYCSPGTSLCTGVHGDQTPPVFDVPTSSPTVTSIRDTTALLTAMMNERGTVYYVVLTRGSAQPSVQEVFSGTGQAGSTNNVVYSGAITVLFADTDFSKTMSGLSATTDYDLWVAAIDTSGNPQTTPTLRQFSTVVDTFAPSFAAGSPAVPSMSHDSFELETAFTDEAGGLMYAVVADGDPAPTAAQIFTGNFGSLTVIVSGSFNVPTVNVLTSTTVTSNAFVPLGQYNVYIISRDNINNYLDPPVMVNVQLTDDTTPPAFSAGFPAVRDVTEMGCTLDVSMDETGDFFFIILNNNALSPSSDAVAGGGGIGVLQAGNGVYGTAGATVSTLVSGLAHNTQFDMYVVGRDANNNLSPPHLVEFTTIVDVNPPVFTTAASLGYTRDTSVDVNGALNEVGTIYAAAVAQGSSLTSAQIKAHATMQSVSAIIPTTVYRVTVTSLTPLTAYTLWVVAEDQHGNLGTTPVSFDTTTVAQTSAVATGYPNVRNITGGNAMVDVVVDTDNSHVYVVILPAVFPAPLPEDMRAGTVAATVASGNTAAPLSNTIVTVPVSGLQDATTYTAWVAVSDSANTMSYPPASALFNSGGDLTPPTFSSGFPTVSTFTDETVDVDVKLSEASTVHYVVLPDGTATPTVVAVTHGTAGGLVIKGSFSVSGGNTLVTETLAGLRPARAYDAYLVAEDVFGNVQTTPTLLEFTTGNDVTAPRVSSGYPLLDPIGSTTATIRTLVSEPCIVYAVALAVPTAAVPATPTAAEVVAGTGAGGSVPSGAVSGNIIGGAVGTVALSGLSPGTKYDVYVVAVDNAGNSQSSPDYLNMTTLSAAKGPRWVSGYPTLTRVSMKTGQLEVQLHAVGSARYIVLNRNAAAPSATAVFDASGNNIVVSGSVKAPTPLQVETTVVTGLTPDTPYDLYVVSADNIGTTGDPVLVRFHTDPDLSPPVDLPNYPRVQNTTDRVADVAVACDEEAVYFVVAVPAGGTAPNTAQVIAGTDGDDNSVLSMSSGSTTKDVVLYFELLNLLPETSYDIYIVGRDTTGNAQAAPTSFSITTLADTTAPYWVAPYPTTEEINGGVAIIGSKTAEPATTFFVVVPTGSPAPTAANIKAGVTGTSNAANATGSESTTGAYDLLLVDVPASHLDYPATYDIWLVLEDTVGLMSATKKITFTTVDDVDPPVWAVGYPSISQLKPRSASLDIMLNEFAYAHYVVFLAGGDAPTVAQVMAHTGPNGETPILSGGPLVRANEVVPISLSPLLETTSYDVFVAPIDLKGLTSPAPMAVHFTTLLDNSAPGGTMSVSNLTDSTWIFNVEFDEPGHFYWIVVPSGSPNPSGGSIVNGLTSTGEVPIGSGNFELVNASQTYNIPAVAFTSPSTVYDLWWVSSDTANTANIGTPTKYLLNTTADVSAPHFVSGFPTITNIGSDTADLEVQLSEAATCYYVVTNADPSVSTIPDVSVADVKAGTVPDTMFVVTSGTGNVIGPLITAVLPLINLQESAPFWLFFVAEDSLGNTQLVTKLVFTTLAGGFAGQAAGQLANFGVGVDSSKFDFTFLIIGAIILLLLILCCCYLGRRKEKYSTLEGEGKVSPDGDLDWDGPPEGDFMDLGASGGRWSPVERESHEKWARSSRDSRSRYTNSRGEMSEMDRGTAIEEEEPDFEDGPVVTKAGRRRGLDPIPVEESEGPGLGELNRSLVVGSTAHRQFVNREMMDLELVLQEAENVSSNVMNRAPELVETLSVTEFETGSVVSETVEEVVETVEVAER